MLITISGRIASISEGKYTTEGTPVVDFQLAVDRGNVKKRMSLLTGKEYDADFYKVSLFGQTALSFVQYAQVGRNVDVSGRLLQDEYLSKNQTIQVATDNPLYGYLKQLVGQLPQDQLSYDNAGNLYIKGNHAVNRANITGLECRWKDKNPNAQSQYNNQGFGGNQSFGGNQGFGGNAQGFGGNTQSGFGGQTQAPAFGTGFGTQQQAPQGFGVQQPQASAGFGVQAQPQMPVPNQPAPAMSQAFSGFNQGTVAPGFGAQPQVQNNGMAGFSGQESPTGNSGFPGFGGASEQPAGFTANQGFAPTVNNGATTPSFTGPTNDNVVNQNVNTNTNATPSVETNIPAPENNANVVATSEKKAETINQGF